MIDFEQTHNRVFRSTDIFISLIHNYGLCNMHIKLIRDVGSGWASRAMALLCFRLVGPEYAMALLVLGH